MVGANAECDDGVTRCPNSIVALDNNFGNKRRLSRLTHVGGLSIGSYPETVPFVENKAMAERNRAVDKVSAYWAPLGQFDE
jgi:hypothetical protein